MHGSGGGFSVAVEKRPFSRRAILLGVTVPRGDSFSAMHLRCAAEPRHRRTCTAGICGDTVPDHLTLPSHRPIRVALPLITQCERRRSRTLHPRNGLTPPSFAVEAETRSIQHAPNRPPHIRRRQEVSGSPMLQPVFCSELSRIGAAGIGAPFRTCQKFLVENHRATL